MARPYFSELFSAADTHEREAARWQARGERAENAAATLSFKAEAWTEGDLREAESLACDAEGFYEEANRLRHAAHLYRTAAAVICLFTNAR